jgi:outer membrane protein TolC
MQSEKKRLKMKPKNQSSRFGKVSLTVATLLIMSGCASLNQDNGFSSIQKISAKHLAMDLAWQRTEGDAKIVKERIKTLLSAPLSVDDAVQLALLNNQGLQANFFELGIAQADLIQVSRLANPGFSFGRLRRGDEVEFERGLHFNLMQLISMPYRQTMEQRRFEQTKHQVVMQVLSLAAETRKAYYMALAADQSAQYMQQVRKSAEAGAELARRMLKAGNFNKLQQAREQNFYAEAILTQARAEQAQVRAHEKLIRLLGLTELRSSLRLPERLPDLPDSADLRENLEQVAMNQRLDVQAARLGTEQLASNLGLSKTTRFINVLELGVIRNTSNEAATQRGYEISLELPIFDWGDAKVAKAEALYMQALRRTGEIATNARSEVRQSHQLYLSSYTIAKHYRDEIVPLKKKISEENLLRYNGMFIGVFDLLADARSQIMSVNAAIEASRDFWLAQADLEMSLIGKANFSDVTSSDMAGSAAPAAAH